MQAPDRIASEFDFDAKSPVQRMLGAVFGFDFFISYAWADGREYALALARRLEDGIEGRKYSCFLDSDDYAMGDDWKSMGREALKKTGILVLVGSPRALGSSAVLHEIQVYSQSKRRIIPIEFMDENGASSLAGGDSTTGIRQYIGPEILRLREPLRFRQDKTDQLMGPSDEVVRQLAASFDLVTEAERRAKLFGGVALIFALVAILALFFWRSSEINRYTAERNEATAIKNAAEAHRQSANALWGLAANARTGERFGLRSSFLLLRGVSALDQIPRKLRSADDGRLRASCLLAAYSGSSPFIKTWPMDDDMTQRVRSFQISLDGSHALLQLADGKAQWVRTADGSLLKTLEVEGVGIDKARISPLGSYVATWNDYDREILVWHTSSKAPLRRWKTEDSPAGIAFSLDERRAIAWAGGTMQVHAVNEAEPVGKIPHVGPVREVSFGPDGSHALTWNESQIFVWRVKDAKLIQTLPFATEYARLSRDHRRVFTWGQLEGLRAWDVATARSSELGNKDSRFLQTMRSNADGSVFLIVSEGRAQTWSTESDRSLHAFTADNDEWLDDGRISASGSRIVAWSEQAVYWWDGLTGKQILRLPIEGGIPEDEDEVGTSRTVASAGDADVVMLHDNYGNLHCVRPRPNQPLHRFQHDQAVKGFCLSPDGSRMLTWTKGKQVKLWDVTQRVELRSFEHEKETNGAAFDDTGTSVLTWSADGAVMLWNLASGVATRSLRHNREVSHAMFCPRSGRILTCTADGVARLWDENNDATPKLTFNSEYRLSQVRLNHDESLFLTWSDDQYYENAQLWDFRTGERIRVPSSMKLLTGFFDHRGARVALLHAGSTLSLRDAKDPNRHLWERRINHDFEDRFEASFSRDDKWLFTHSVRSSEVSVWRCDGRPEQYFTCRHKGVIGGAAFSRDSTRLITWGDDKIARLWSIPDREPLQTYVHPAVVAGAQLSDDDSRLLTWSGSDRICVWDLGKSEPMVVIDYPVTEAMFAERASYVLSRLHDDITVSLWRCDDPMSHLSLDERILELEVRTGTKLDADNNVAPLDFESWRKKSEKLNELRQKGRQPLSPKQPSAPAA